MHARGNDTHRGWNHSSSTKGDGASSVPATLPPASLRAVAHFWTRRRNCRLTSAIVNRPAVEYIDENRPTVKNELWESRGWYRRSIYPPRRMPRSSQRVTAISRLITCTTTFPDLFSPPWGPSTGSFLEAGTSAERSEHRGRNNGQEENEKENVGKRGGRVGREAGLVEHGLTLMKTIYGGL